MAKKAPDDAWLYLGFFLLIVLMIIGCSWYLNDTARV